MFQAQHLVLIDALLDRGKSQLHSLGLLFIGTLILTLSAKFKIPFYPVPMTLQTLVVLLIGVTFGWRLGFATIIFYLAQGLAGFPVFAGTPEKGLGFVYMVGPTGGYLVGFALAAAVTGWMAEHGFDRSLVGTAVAMLCGNIVIYICGLAWLGQFVGYSEKLLAFGITPFILGDLAKIALAAVSIPFIWRWINRDKILSEE